MRSVPLRSTAALARIIRDNPDGFTVDLKTLEPMTKGYVVAPVKPAEIIIPGRDFYDEDLEDYNAMLYDMLESSDDLDVYAGGWFSDEKQAYFLDAVHIFDDEATAVYTAHEAQQDAIFNLSTFETVTTQDAITKLQEAGTYQTDAADVVRRKVEALTRRFESARHQRHQREASSPREVVADSPPAALTSQSGPSLKPAEPVEQDELGYISHALESMKATPLTKGTGQQFYNRLKKAGVKDDELEWSGFMDMLREQGFEKKQWTKPELVEYLRANRIVLKEVELSDEISHTHRADVVRQLRNLVTSEDHKILAKHGITVHLDTGHGHFPPQPLYFVEDYGGTFRPGFTDAVNPIPGAWIDVSLREFEPEFTRLNSLVFRPTNVPKGAVVEHFRSVPDLLKFLGIDSSNKEPIEAAARIQRMYDDILHAKSTYPNPKFSQYTLPGGTNYKEFVISVPHDQPAFREPPRDLEITTHFGETVTVPGTAERYAPEYAVEPTAVGHFSKVSTNVVAHVRTTDRTVTSPGGTGVAKKVFFLEEVQSDWAASLRRQSGVPVAPFIEATQDWTALALKRMMRYAADHDYDYVAWTPGKVQQDRYDLSTHVKSIDVYDDVNYPRQQVSGARYWNKIVHVNDERGDRYISTTVDPDGRMVDGAHAGKPLSELVGKELADKIMSAPIPKRPSFSEADGQRLQALERKGTDNKPETNALDRGRLTPKK